MQPRLTNEDSLDATLKTEKAILICHQYYPFLTMCSHSYFQYVYLCIFATFLHDYNYKYEN